MKKRFQTNIDIDQLRDKVKSLMIENKQLIKERDRFEDKYIEQLNKNNSLWSTVSKIPEFRKIKGFESGFPLLK